MAHLTLYDFRDLDLMLTVAEHVNEDGEISTHDLAGELGMDSDVQAVAVRMSWMRRYGVFSFDENRRMWRLTRGGQRVLEAKQQAASTPALEAVPDAALVDVMAHVTSRYRHGDPLTATLLRREFLFGTKPGSAAYRKNGGRRRR
jgi:hypothetical protein